MQNVLQKNIKDEFAQIVKRYLSVGMAVKNYSAMCKLLNQEEKIGTRSKKYQMEDWKRYLDWEKAGHKFIILKIYDEPLEKIDKRSKGNNSEYLPHIELILLNYLSKQEGYKATFTVRQLFLMLSMVNRNYIEKDYQKVKEQNSSISKWQYNHFYQRSYQKLKEVLFGALNNLKNRRLIDYEKLTMIKIREFVDGSLRNTVRLATDDEKNYIRDTQREVLKEMKLESITQVFLKSKTEEFYNRVNQLLWERYNIYFSFIEIEILFTHKYIIEALEQAEINMERKMLNGKVVNFMNKQAENNYEKSQQEYDKQVEEYMEHILGRPSEMALSKFFRLNDMYLEVQEKLAEILIEM